MKVSDLKSGVHVIQDEYGENFVVCSFKGGEIFLMGEVGNRLLGVDFKIEKVGLTSFLACFNELSSFNEWIWERKPEKKELTVKQIEEELGYEIKIVK